MTSPGPRHPARLRPSERGILHGLSLLAITLAFAVAILFFALKEVPLRCQCADKSIQEGKQTGFDSAQRRCEMICGSRGGGTPLKKKASKP